MVVDDQAEDNVTRSKRVVEYVRGSGHVPFPSLEAQREAISAKCEGEGWELVEPYEDSGLTGAQRPGFQRLMADARGGSFDAVVVSSHDRLTRGVQTALGTAQALEDLGIELVSLA